MKMKMRPFERAYYADVDTEAQADETRMYTAQFSTVEEVVIVHYEAPSDDEAKAIAAQMGIAGRFAVMRRTLI